MTSLAEGFFPEWGQPHLPMSDGFVRQDHLPRERHLCQVPRAELVAEPLRDRKAEHVGGIRQPIPSINALDGCRRLIEWAHHRPILLAEEVSMDMLCHQKRRWVSFDTTGDPSHRGDHPNHQTTSLASPKKAASAIIPTMMSRQLTASITLSSSSANHVHRDHTAPLVDSGGQLLAPAVRAGLAPSIGGAIACETPWTG